MTDLLPCPFCGAGETMVDEKRMSPRMNGTSELISVSVRHWCGSQPGIVASHTEYRGRDRESAVAAWNKRTHPAPTVTEPLMFTGNDRCPKCLSHHPMNFDCQAGKTPLTPPSAEPSAEAREHVPAKTERQAIIDNLREWACNEPLGSTLAIDLEDAASYISRTPAQGGVTEPVPMILWCPKCHASHLDKGEWATRPHKAHLCEYCGMEWRPANIPTVGVLSLTAALSSTPEGEQS